MSSDNISTLITNARSRAAVLSSLDNAFDTKLQNTHKKPLNEVEQSLITHSDRDAFIDHLQELLRGTGVYSRQRIEDQIKGKTIVLQHLRSGSTTAMAKLKKEHKGHWRASNGYLKTVNKIPSTIGSEEATVLKSMFKGYLKQLCSGCKNTAQLQARMLTSELTGATVLIVESIEPSARYYIGRKGIIISESLNCFHVAYEVSKDDRVVCQGKKGKKRRRREKSGTDQQQGKDKSPRCEEKIGKDVGNEIEDSSNVRSAAKIAESHDLFDGDIVTPPLVVIRVIKSKCRIAVTIDTSFLSFMQGGGGRSTSQQVKPEPPLMCIIHGKHYLPHLENNFNSLPESL